MIEEGSGNLLTADVEALINTVNTVGVMGKGIALQFKRALPGRIPERFRPLVWDGDRPGYLAPVAHCHRLVPPVRPIASPRLYDVQMSLQQPGACFPISLSMSTRYDSHRVFLNGEDDCGR